MIYIVNKRRKIEGIRKQYPDSNILDVTSSSTLRYAQLLSPFFPHGDIPIPGDSRDMTAMSVEGIWQGLKVFPNEGICFDSFNNATMKNLKRTVKMHGKPLGHQYGVYSNELLDYLTARIKIYLPSYRYVLENVDQFELPLEETVGINMEGTHEQPMSEAEQESVMNFHVTQSQDSKVEKPVENVEYESKTVNDSQSDKSVAGETK